LSSINNTTNYIDETQSVEEKVGKGSGNNNQGRMISHDDVIAQFRDAMRAAGLLVETGDIIPDGKIQRCKTEKCRGGRKNGFYRLFTDGTPAGFFGSWTGARHTWRADVGSVPMSAEEGARLRADRRRKQAHRATAIKDAQNKAAVRAKKIWNEAVPADASHPYLARKGVNPHNLRVGKWWKWDAETGKQYLACENALLVPMYGLKRDIRSLQAIFPGKVEISGDLRDKDYLPSGERSGVFHVIGMPQEIDGRKVVIVAEGYATASSIHEATGHCVLVAFDTGNLLPTAQVFRSKYEDAVIVFAADNDWGTITPINNPGVHYATKAAAAVNGVVAIPIFSDVSGLPKGGDFNDLAHREGAGAVEAQIDVALNPAPEAVDEHEAADVLLADGEARFPLEARDVPRKRPTSQAEAEDVAAQEVEERGGFKVMGYNRGVYYVFSHRFKQMFEIKNFTIGTLTDLAEASFWEGEFPGKADGARVNIVQAMEFIKGIAMRRGLYDPNCIRNGGAWSDAGRHVFHHGDHLTVDGKRMPVTAIRSRYTYEATLPLPEPADVALTDAEGRHIYDIAQRFNWDRNSSAALLAGWTLLAPLCGALKWRPHIFLTGPAGNGKSTILRDFVHALIGDGGCVYAQGNSTEAGVRQDIGSTSLPVLLDEAEKNNDRETARMEAILSLIRQSSTESAARTLKGTIAGDGMKFNVRSMFCLAAIFTGLERKADIDRLSILSLKPSRGDQVAAVKWEETRELLHVFGRKDDNVRGKMLRRALHMLPTIMTNIAVFTRAAAVKFGSQRDGDQIGTLLAGTWSLTNSTVATPERAREMMDALDWTAHAEAAEADDSESALQELMGAFITVLGTKHSVHNLVSFALGKEVEGRSLDAHQARAELRQHGIAIDGNKLALSNSSSALKRLLAGTPFATDPRAAFSRLPGSDKNHRQLKFNGKQTRVTALPLEAIGFGGKNIESEEEVFG